MNIVHVQKIHPDLAVITNIEGKLDHVTYTIASTHNFPYCILMTCIVVLLTTALMTISQSFLLPALKIETNYNLAGPLHSSSMPVNFSLLSSISVLVSLVKRDAAQLIFNIYHQVLKGTFTDFELTKTTVLNLSGADISVLLRSHSI